jgi:transglutaminase-like putative cysteine protease
MARLALLAALAAALAAAAPARSQDPSAPGRVLLEEWHAVWVGGRLSGHARLVFREEAAEGPSRVRFERVVEIRFGKAPSSGGFRSVYRGLEDPAAGTILSFSFETSDGARGFASSGLFEAGTLKTALPGGSAALPGGAPGPWAALLRAREGAKAGKPFPAEEFDPRTGGTVEWSRTPAGEEGVARLGRVERFAKFSVESASLPGGAWEWRDREGALVRTLHPAGDMVTLLADADFVRRGPEMTPVSVAFREGEAQAEGRTYRFRGPLASAELRGPGQLPARAGDDWAVLVQRERLPVRASDRPAVPSFEAAPFTGADAWLDWGRDAVQKRVAEIGENEPKDLGAATAAARWVGANVREDSGGTFLPASEALKAGRANSFGRAALAAALCRGLSVPARLVAGLRRSGPSLETRFWVEAWAAEDWVALDPSAPSGLAGDDCLRARVLDTRKEHPEAFYFRFVQDLQTTSFH